MIRVMACTPKPVPPPPPPKKIKPRPQLKKAIDQAMLLCRNFEDTVECKLAWDLVEDLSKGIPPPAYVDEEICEDDELACREYDT
jgi:hypothetical protein